MTNDVSVNTLIISSVVALTGWALKGIGVLIVDTCKKLIETLLRTITKVEVLESKINVILEMQGDVQKLKFDVTQAHNFIRELKKPQ